MLNTVDTNPQNSGTAIKTATAILYVSKRVSVSASL
jgi:hypothetical protein